ALRQSGAENGPRLRNPPRHPRRPLPAGVTGGPFRRPRRHPGGGSGAPQDYPI
ncbi:MAG: hypothetical protein AVDCRST_MAG86-3129, partial [uncultured Truepera sp.]